jgi:uroporphyrinogen-III decarboxylase
MIDAGADCIEPLEAKANMDIRELAPLYGNRAILFGNIDMTVANTNDRDLVEHEVRTKLAAGMAARCYMYHSDHSVPPGVSWATYQYIHELLDQYGRY